MALSIRVLPRDLDSAGPHSPASLASLASPASPLSPAAHDNPQKKLHGRTRLLHGFQRMSSSPSLARLGRSNSSGYKAGKASVSCISLNSSAIPFDPSSTTDLASGFATPPASNATTPGIQIPVFDERARVRYLEHLHSHSTAAIPRSVGRLTPGIVEEQDYFSIRAHGPITQRTHSNLWQHLPAELKFQVLSYLSPKEVVRCSSVSKSWHETCFDGQLWAILDTNDFYRSIPAESLVSIITTAGPFVRDLNLRGCVQLRDRWTDQGLADACRNLEYFSLEGCKIDRTSIHCFFLQNPRLVHVNLSGLHNVTNASLKIIAQHCQRLEHLNVSWCENIDTRGLKKVVESCPNLSDLRAGETRGWDDVDFLNLLFKTNRLERLIAMNCASFNDASLKTLMEGADTELDILTGRVIVPARRLRHIDFSRCVNITDRGISACVHNLENLEGLQLSKCVSITDDSLQNLLPTLPRLTHLDVEELDQLTNACLHTLAQSPCSSVLRHLSISYCENLGDTGMLAVLKTCKSLESLEMDNTRISDLVLAEAASLIRNRSTRTTDPKALPSPGLSVIAYDCQNVTWTGIREILSRNAEVVTQRRIIPPAPIVRSVTEPTFRTSADLTKSVFSVAAPPSLTAETVQLVRTYPTEIISLKCFYNYQPTVHEHTKRVLRGDFSAAKRLERKWAEFMMANEEAGVTGTGHGARRRRRRAREAQMMHADEAEEGAPPTGSGGGVGGGRRRRARSGGCAVM